MPTLPYDGSSGWSGSDTSRERAEREDAGDVSAMREGQAIAFLAKRGTRGATWKDLAEAHGWHHGQASGVLSRLHKAGVISRLVEVDRRCKVYVLPEYQSGRQTEPHGRRSVVRVAVRERQAQRVYSVLRNNTELDILECRHLTRLILEAVQP